MALLEEDLLARDGEQRADILAEDLDVVQVRVVPVRLRRIEKVHQRVVLGVGEAVADPNRDAVLLMQVLPALELLRVLSQRRARHLVDALLLKLVLHPVHLLPARVGARECGGGRCPVPRRVLPAGRPHPIISLR